MAQPVVLAALMMTSFILLTMAPIPNVLGNEDRRYRRSVAMTAATDFAQEVKADKGMKKVARLLSGSLSGAEARLVAAMADARTKTFLLRSNIILSRSLPELTKEFKVVGSCGRRRCVIDGRRLHRGFVSSASLSLSNLELIGFKTAGRDVNEFIYTPSGAAVFMSGGSLSVKSCVFRANVAVRANGAAIALVDVPYEINDSSFVENKAEGSGGAIIVWSNSFGTIKGSTFSKNQAGFYGGAAYFRESGITFTSCEFSQNRALTQNGGALLLSSAESIIAKTTFTRNSAPRGLGGAVRVVLDDATVRICSSTKFVSNSAKVYSERNVSVLRDDSNNTVTYCPKRPASRPASCSVCN